MSTFATCSRCGRCIAKPAGVVIHVLCPWCLAREATEDRLLAAKFDPKATLTLPYRRPKKETSRAKC